ncbi:hypothetical protein BBJ28_00016411 [Nothophytophthora sp. Chile5]|nr:hypothetical protein BBJ28_00016411 [Nothophytophthora sp. Chile5]
MRGAPVSPATSSAPGLDVLAAAAPPIDEPPASPTIAPVAVNSSTLFPDVTPPHTTSEVAGAIASASTTAPSVIASASPLDSAQLQSKVDSARFPKAEAQSLVNTAKAAMATTPSTVAKSSRATTPSAVPTSPAAAASPAAKPPSEPSAQLFVGVQSARRRRSSSLPGGLLPLPQFVSNPTAPQRFTPRLVGVPASIRDVISGAPVRTSAMGIERLVEVCDLSTQDFADLTRLARQESSELWLRPRPHDSSEAVVTSLLDHVQLQRELIPVLRRYGPERFARRIFGMSQCMQAVLTRVRELEGAQHPDSGQMIASQSDCRHLRRELERSRVFWEGRVTQLHRQHAVQLDELQAVHRGEYATAIRERDARIASLVTELAELRLQLGTAVADNVDLRVQLQNSRLPHPWGLLDFFHEHTQFNTNWERLRDLLRHYQVGSDPPLAWRRTRVDITALDLDVSVPAPYPSLSERSGSGTPSETEAKSEEAGPSEPTSSGTLVPRLTITDNTASTPLVASIESTTGSGSDFPIFPRKLVAKALAIGVTGSLRNAELSSTSHSPLTIVDLTGSSAGVGTSGDMVSVTPPRPAQLQRRPSGYVGGVQGARDSLEIPPVTSRQARDLLPQGITWGSVRGDVQELMLYGSTYQDALELVRQPAAAHTQFRCSKLLLMLESMVYWNQMDGTPWVRYVPSSYFQAAITNLEGATMGVPAVWDPSPLLLGALATHPASGNSAYVTPNDEWQPDFSSQSSHGDSNDGDFQISPPSRKRAAGPMSATKRPKRQKAISMKGVSSLLRRSPLAAKDYDRLTPAELEVIEDPSPTESSWRHLGILVQRQAIPRGASVQNVGFPVYAPAKTNYKELKPRWHRGRYEVLLLQEPWESMYDDRVTELYFHRRLDLTAEVLRGLRRYVDFMRVEARKFWEIQHWVTIDDERDDVSNALYFDRKSRRDRFVREFAQAKTRLERVRGFKSSLWEEPGLWVPPRYVCHWIWRDPHFSDVRSSLESQLEELDRVEPIRTQWATRNTDADFLQHVAPSVRSHALTPTERARNLILG